jgi:hypothetical protein
MEIQWKYSGNKLEINRAGQPAAGRLGEIFSNTYSKLFHGAKRSLFQLYFNPISPARLPTVGRPQRVFPFIISRSEAESISTVFLPYLYRISYLVLRIFTK